MPPFLLHSNPPFQCNSEPKDISGHVPEYLYDLHSVFSKESFNNLPESKPWDHAIKLVLEAKAKSYKVYPLAVSEQKELDDFLKENLDSKWIRPSKSPMASLVFFIKKKDGSL